MNERDASLLIDEIYDSLSVHLVNYAVHLGGSLDLAEDVAQETFLRLYRALREGQTIRQPKAWAFSVMRHELGKQLQRQSERTVTPEGWRSLEESSWSSDTANERFLATDELEHLLDLLTEREKEVLLLRLGSLKYREIGEELGISVKTVHTLLTRALGKIQQRMPETPGRKEDASVAKRPRPTLQ
jgi:RNA polymerase sigma-70 factor (ECF subfamily)